MARERKVPIKRLRRQGRVTQGLDARTMLLGEVPLGNLPHHAHTHEEGGVDPIDITTLDGYSGDADDVLHGDKTFGPAVPTVDGILSLGYWTIATNGDPVSPEIEFDSNGDVASYFVPTP